MSMRELRSRVSLRPAIARGKRVSPSPTREPFCFSLFSRKPAFRLAVLRSDDRGATWDFIDPKGDPPRTGSNDMNMWVDRRSGRVFWSNDIELPVVHVQRVDYSDDDGRTWFPSSPLPMHFDHTQLFSGPPTRRSEDSIHRDPNVVYAVVSGGF